MIPKKVKTIAQNQILYLGNQLERARSGRPIYGKAFWLLLGDVQNLIKYYNLVLDGKYYKAQDYYSDLDTESRDGISSTIVNFVEKMTLTDEERNMVKNGI